MLDTLVRLPIVEDVAAQEPPPKRQCRVTTGRACFSHVAGLCKWAWFSHVGALSRLPRHHHIASGPKIGRGSLPPSG